MCVCVCRLSEGVYANETVWEDKEIFKAHCWLGNFTRPKCYIVQLQWKAYDPPNWESRVKIKAILLTNKSNVNTQKPWMPALQCSNVQLEEMLIGSTIWCHCRRLCFWKVHFSFFFLSLKQDIYMCNSAFTHLALPCAFIQMWQTLVIFLLRHWYTSLACRAKTSKKRRLQILTLRKGEFHFGGVCWAHWAHCFDFYI